MATLKQKGYIILERKRGAREVVDGMSVVVVGGRYEIYATKRTAIEQACCSDTIREVEIVIGESAEDPRIKKGNKRVIK